MATDEGVAPVVSGGLAEAPPAAEVPREAGSASSALSADEADNIKYMYYFYVLRFKKNRKLYYGFSSNLRNRIRDHKSGKSDFTSKNGPFDLIFYEAYKNEKDARSAERYFKTGHGREVLRDKLKNYFNDNTN